MPTWLQFNFWFQIRPWNTDTTILLVLSVVMLVMLVIGFVILWRVKKKEAEHAIRVKRQIGAWFITWGGLGLAWLFFVYERINVFGSPFWILLGFVGAVIWLVFILKYALRTAPRLRALEVERAAREKYLPKPKH